MKNNRFGIGSRVGLLRKGSGMLWRRAHADSSYLSANDARVHFGLGGDPGVKAVVVKWLGGKAEIWDEVEVDTLITLREGSGKPWREDESGGANRRAPSE